MDTQPGRIAPSGNTPECPIAAAGTEASGTGIAADGSHDVIVDVERGPASGFAVPVGDGSYFVFREPAPPALPAPQPPVSRRTA